jgi:hypothetical protein
LYCNRCGHRNPVGANFCSSCGAPLERRETATEPDAPEHQTSATPAVVLFPGDGSSEPFLLEPSDLLHGVPPGGAVLVITIGRHPESDIFLDDITVSRRHAEVRYVEGAYRAHDIGSLNGTYLNRERIDTAPLASGDELQVGKFRLLFLAPGQGPGAGHAAGTA